MPFGVKADPAEGRTLNFDQIYSSLVAPAAAQAGYSAIRADEFSGQVILRPILERIIWSDVFIADVSTGNPNVMYELGLRHSLSRSATILIMESRSRLPFDLSLFRVLTYRVDDNGLVMDDGTVSHLAEAIRQGIGRSGSDSPIYTFFPEIQVELPNQPLKSPKRVRIFKQGAQAEIATSDSPIVSLKQAEQEIRTSSEVDPTSVLDVLRGYQVNSAWQDLVTFASDLPQPMKDMPQVQQMTALALNRLGRQQEAISLLRSLAARTGGDSETFGILGRIYKDVYTQTSDHDKAYLDLAIDSYRSAFKMSPNDYYSGLNLVSLLAAFGGPDTHSELNELVLQLRAQLEQRISDPRADYWAFDASLLLAVIARDWNGASALWQRMGPLVQGDWMLASTKQNLRSLGTQMNEADRSQLERLIETISGVAPHYA